MRNKYERFYLFGRQFKVHLLSEEKKYGKEWGLSLVTDNPTYEFVYNDSTVEDYYCDDRKTIFNLFKDWVYDDFRNALIDGYPCPWYFMYQSVYFYKDNDGNFDWDKFDFRKFMPINEFEDILYDMKHGGWTEIKGREQINRLGMNIYRKVKNHFGRRFKLFEYDYDGEKRLIATDWFSYELDPRQHWSLEQYTKARKEAKTKL